MTKYIELACNLIAGVNPYFGSIHTQWHTDVVSHSDTHILLDVILTVRMSMSFRIVAVVLILFSDEFLLISGTLENKPPKAALELLG